MSDKYAHTNSMKASRRMLEMAKVRLKYNKFNFASNFIIQYQTD